MNFSFDDLAARFPGVPEPTLREWLTKGETPANWRSFVPGFVQAARGTGKTAMVMAKAEAYFEKNPPIVVSPEKPKKPKMNKTEMELHRILQARFPNATIYCQAIRFELADRCTYMPDFIIWHEDGRIDAWEIKEAMVWDDAIVKYKVFARAYPHVKITVAQKKKGQWIEKEIQP